MALALGESPTLASDTLLPAAAQTSLAELVARRAAREPYAYLAGIREFMGLEFLVSRAALIPRPETECLVETLLAAPPARCILDLGTGTGALLLSLLTWWKEAHGVGIDRSTGALALAARNVRRLGLQSRALVVASDWCAALRPGALFDLVVCNPPYVPSHEIDTLAPEIRDFEPRLALDGGEDGLDPVRVLLHCLPSVLQPGARVMFETDHRQWDALAARVERSGAEHIACIPDLSGRRRGLLARFPNPSA